MAKKLSKKAVDVTFYDIKTMQPRCTFNQCVDKFTIEDYEVHTASSGKEFVTAFHVCSECGQKVKAKGDGTRAYKKWLDLQAQKSPDDLDPDTRMKLYMAGKIPDYRINKSNDEK